MVSLLLSPGQSLSVSWGKGRGGGILRARRDKDLTGLREWRGKAGRPGLHVTGRGSRRRGDGEGGRSWNHRGQGL